MSKLNINLVLCHEADKNTGSLNGIHNHFKKGENGVTFSLVMFISALDKIERDLHLLLISGDGKQKLLRKVRVEQGEKQASNDMHVNSFTEVGLEEGLYEFRVLSTPLSEEAVQLQDLTQDSTLEGLVKFKVM
ncbi:hypothetical protein BTR23_19530 [Alkalihalophilus pseudofirmus]|uniref:hypothetical protein n=1 Tax=Alkalihalobacterium alkalinitrilicum TaxID=427920 RepID=UPI00094D1969|nr:hypothetical protein [Alkalihalobacterium alkalinitrilicum]OLO27618.1 hypothetical protein BTR23_19530 [Alkalihalophilus pseudofirmus]